MLGYMGKILKVDLSSGEIKVEPISEEWCRDFIGGEGLGVRLFHDMHVQGAGPLAAEQPFILATGPLTGTSAPSSGRACAVFRSPATGTLGASNIGGQFAPALKKAGFDVLAVTGRAASPVYLYVNNGEAEIRDASRLWGQDVPSTDKALKEEIGEKGLQACVIGIGGENLVNYASIMTDTERAAGRGGGGAVMGSKNMKGIVVKGTIEVEIADSNALKEVSKQVRGELKGEAFSNESLKPLGTPCFYDSINALGLLPTKNWQQTTYPEGAESLSSATYHKTLDVKPYACAKCPTACGRKTTIKEGPYAGSHGGGPEFETMGAFGPKCLINDINVIAKAGHLCNEFGLDTISTGQAIANAMDWYEQGLLTQEDTDGVDLTFGNAEAMIELIGKIARREGFGNRLAQGVKLMAEELGGNAMDTAMQVKGLEMASCGVRGSKAEGVAHAVSPRGADHLRPYASVVDAFGYQEPELGIEGEVDYLEDGNKEWVKPFQEYSMSTNLMGVCLFTVITLAVKPTTWAAALSATVGYEVTKEDLLKASERVITMERMINAGFGFDRKDDTLPKRLLTEPAPDGRGKGQVIDLDVALNSYYTSMGWDLETGLPTAETLETLGLTWMA